MKKKSTKTVSRLEVLSVDHSKVLSEDDIHSLLKIFESGVSDSLTYRSYLESWYNVEDFANCPKCERGTLVIKCKVRPENKKISIWEAVFELEGTPEMKFDREKVTIFAIAHPPKRKKVSDD